MKIVTNLQHREGPTRIASRPFARQECLVVGLDLEWTKNYRVKNGNRFFCYSLVHISKPANPPMSLDLATARIGFRSVYAESESEIGSLVELLDNDLAEMIDSDSIIVGHQLSSDLSVARASSSVRHSAVDAVYDLWRTRSGDEPRRLIDTRYDVDHIVEGIKSRRLVDVCELLKLDVDQPELRGTSMTALHNAFLDSGDPLIRERLSVMNMRHSMSSLIVGLIAMGLCTPGPFNTNYAIHQHLWDKIDYVDSDEFRELL